MWQEKANITYLYITHINKNQRNDYTKLSQTYYEAIQIVSFQRTIKESLANGETIFTFE